MITPRLFVCSGAKVATESAIAAGRQRIELDAIGSTANVNIRFENVAKVCEQHISPRLVDLLEIASYVFCADCGTRRGTEWTDDHSAEPWSRDFVFVIPVRQPEFWGSEKMTSLITELLTFLSNDKYSFRFVSLKRDRPQQEYFEFGDKDWAFYNPERVLMFSGGLDSLAGAVETARGGGNVVLVSHRPVTTLDSRQRLLFDELSKEFPGQLIHIPVWINKDDRFRQEPTQRTRSLLYSALGAVVAHSIQAGGVRFFENGVVSLNLPVADEVLRARASRTTHPVALQLLQSLYSAVTNRDFKVDNPYIFKTKTEVVSTLVTNKAAHLIPYTCSCAHLMFKPKTQWHCGTCSQCIDRRFGIIAAGLRAHDLETDYVSDVFVGLRKDGPEKNMAVDYVRHGIELSQRSESELTGIFNAELSRAVRYEPKRSEAAEKMIAMHKRHGAAVKRVLKEIVAEQASNILDGAIESTSLLGLALGRKHLEGRQFVSANEHAQSKPAKIQAQTILSSPAAMPINIEEIVKSVLGKVGGPSRRSVAKTRKPLKRDTVIFAAILNELRAFRYCQFLHDHGLKPKWPDPVPTTYLNGYKLGDPWRKKIQDEKTRARARMDQCTNADLANALITHLPSEFDSLIHLVHSRDSHLASKTSEPN